MTHTPLARMIGAAFGAGAETDVCRPPVPPRRKTLRESPAPWHSALLDTCRNDPELRRDYDAQARLSALEQDNARLVDAVAALRQTLTNLRREHQRITGELQSRLADASRQLQQQTRAEDQLAAARQLTGPHAELKISLEAFSRRNAELERENASTVRRADAMQREVAAAREQLAAAAAAQEAILAIANGENDADADNETLPAGLAGRSIVCVGGRTALVDHYRRLAEGKGARFVHHDGGQEENPHRIDALIAGADIVLCQAGYISHPTYWRLKEACKRRGLPCVFLKSAGVTSFARGLEAVATRDLRSAAAAERPVPS